LRISASKTGIQFRGISDSAASRFFQRKQGAVCIACYDHSGRMVKANKEEETKVRKRSTDFFFCFTAARQYASQRHIKKSHFFFLFRIFILR
jgi:hypothetical protein